MHEIYGLIFRIHGKNPQKDGEFCDVIGIKSGNRDVQLLPQNIYGGCSPLAHMNGYFTRIYDTPQLIGKITKIKKVYKTITDFSEKDQISSNELRRLFTDGFWLNDSGESYKDKLIKTAETDAVQYGLSVGVSKAKLGYLTKLGDTSEPAYWLEIIPQSQSQ